MPAEPDGVRPGPSLDGTVPQDEIAEMIDHSWERVVAKLSRGTRDLLRTLQPRWESR
ncbi:hypothetical protein [Streptomyces sp. NPDC053079]|uniref:hypothetical protein n=1 Tax=Streptomyces sp. NPDC053079 TaxID=3365697 RepID=UPI0037D0A270